MMLGLLPDSGASGLGVFPKPDSSTELPRSSFPECMTHVTGAAQKPLSYSLQELSAEVAGRANTLRATRHFKSEL